MTDITTIPTGELLKDLSDSYADIEVCKAAIKVGVMTYSGGDVARRLDENLYFVKVISTELNRRTVWEGRVMP